MQETTTDTLLYTSWWNIDAASFAHFHDLYPVIYHFGKHYSYGLVPKRRNHIANALQVSLSYISP